MVYFLDEKAKFTGTTNSTEAYARACSDAVDEALAEWQIEERTKNATVSTGFIGDNKLSSYLWTQSFDTDTVTETENENENEDGGSALKFEDLLSNLKDLLISSENYIAHAKKWDATFAGASIVGKLSDKEALVHWKFDAPPLRGRDMMFVAYQLTDESPSQTQTNDDPHGVPVLRITFAYASVSDDWAKQHSRKETVGDNNSWCKRVRAFNCYPSCDRITVYDNPSSSGGGKKIVLDHLTTTDLGGWVGPCCFNNLMKEAHIQAYAHECEAVREYVLSLCKTGK